VKQVATLLVIGLASAVFGTSKAYDVVPFGNCVAEIASVPNNGIMQYYRNTLDSITRVSVWVGDVSDQAVFDVQIKDSVTGVVVAEKLGQAPGQSWSWLNFDLTPKPDKPTRGRTYKVTVKNQDGLGAISFAYDPTNPYKFGKAVANGSSPTLDSLADLALRVEGLHDTICLTDFGVNLPAFPYWQGIAAKEAWSRYLDSSQARWAPVTFAWDTIEWQAGQYDFWTVETIMGQIPPGVEPVGLLVNCPRWASTAAETVITWIRDTMGESGRYDTTIVPSVHCPPRNLDSGANYFARWVDTIVDTYGDRIHTWLAWNEPNDTCTEYIPNITGWWRRPDSTYYQLGPGARPLCSLYMRLCWVADSVIKHANNRPDDRVLIGNMHKVRFTDDWRPRWLVPGVDWLDLCEDVADSVFWDGVGFHGYQDLSWFDSDTFAEDVDTLRAIMRFHDDYGELWNTEVGWAKDTLDKLESRERAARNACQMVVSTKASSASPDGSCERVSWWFFWENNPRWGHEPLVNCTFDPQPAFHAFSQACTVLAGKRLNRRVMMGDSTDDSVRVYEFEDTTAEKKRTWVCWSIPVTDPPSPVSAKLPVRNDEVDTLALDYDGSEPTDQKYATSTGWLNSALLPRPVFVTETESACRPDVVVDSLRVLPSPLAIGRPATAHVYFHNAGGDTTPLSGPLSNDYTWVVLRHNGNSVAEISYHSPLAPDSSGSVTFNIDAVPSGWHGMALFDATANYEQRYVEQYTMDDNDGYSRNRIVWPPIGEIGVVCGSHSNAPLPLLGFETRSMEADTTGETPCDSARLVQWFYGNDTVVHGGDTTAWFDASSAVALDTSWLYLSGQGKYRLFLQVKDSWSMSDLIPDTTHPFVVFDTTGPLGSIVINDGARFAPSSTCTLALAACDSASGVGWMRFMNRPPVDLVENGGFLATAGSWSFANGAYDTSLAMAKLSAGPPQAGVRQVHSG
jgi:hypothetical protein